MRAYIKDKKTFRTKFHGIILDWELTLQSIYDEVSSFRIRGGETDILSGDFVFAGRYSGIVKEVAPDKEYLNITCNGIGMMFDRRLLPVADAPGDSVEAYIKRQIDSNYVNQPDEIYSLPFLDVITETHTAGSATPDIEDGTWSIKSYISKARRLYNIHTDFFVIGDRLVMRIAHRDRLTRKVFLDNSQYELLEESFSNDAVGKITTVAEDTGETKDWYLLDNGAVTNAYTADNRIDGLWEVLNVRTTADALQEVRDKFAENSKSHLIEFAAAKDYNFYDDVIIRTKKGLVLSSYISAIRLEQGRSKTVYKSGELRMTLDEKLNAKLGGR